MLTSSAEGEISLIMRYRNRRSPMSWDWKSFVTEKKTSVASVCHREQHHQHRGASEDTNVWILWPVDKRNWDGFIPCNAVPCCALATPWASNKLSGTLQQQVVLGPKGASCRVPLLESNRLGACGDKDRICSPVLLWEDPLMPTFVNVSPWLSRYRSLVMTWQPQRAGPSEEYCFRFRCER